MMRSDSTSSFDCSCEDPMLSFTSDVDDALTIASATKTADGVSKRHSAISSIASANSRNHLHTRAFNSEARLRGDESPVSVAVLFDGSLVSSSLSGYRIPDDQENLQHAPAVLVPKAMMMLQPPQNNMLSVPSLPPTSPTPLPSPKISQKQQERRKVRFDPTCSVRRTLSRMDMTPKEIRRTWIQDHEFDKIQERDATIASRIQRGRSKTTTCTRGLESKIRNTWLRRKSAQRKGVEEVLLEQERQWDAVYYYESWVSYDFGAFAFVYEKVSKPCRIRAEEVARKDRLEAEAILAASDESPFSSPSSRPVSSNKAKKRKPTLKRSETERVLPRLTFSATRRSSI